MLQGHPEKSWNRSHDSKLLDRGPALGSPSLTLTPTVGLHRFRIWNEGGSERQTSFGPPQCPG